MSENHETRRQILYWRLLAGIFDADAQPTLETGSLAVIEDLGLPAALLEPGVAIDTVIQRFPDLEHEFDAVGARAGVNEDAVPGVSEALRALEAVEAQKVPVDDVADDTDSTAGTSDTGLAAPGTRAPGDDTGAESVAGPGDSARRGVGTGGPVGAEVDETDSGTVDIAIWADEVRNAALLSKLLLNVFATGSGAVTATQLACWQRDAGWLKRMLGTEGGGSITGVLADLEADLVSRMRLREVLADPALAAQLTPSMSLVEQLLRDKSNLSGVALANAKALIRRYVEEVAQVLRTQVQQTSAGTLDRSVPPKRILRNLDVDRTIWKNLTNWNPEDERLYVDRLFYRQTAKRVVPATMIVVVDQSGSMVDAMVNCTILASIFAGLPKVDVHLIAYDTRAIDLTPWVHDPFEVLLRTQLGGGTHGPVAMTMARPKITDPANTVLVWISDFYDAHELLESMQAVHRSGVKLIPVGSVNSSGHQSVNPWFRERLKAMGTPVLSGRIQKLVTELKTFLD
ncbi:VWA domain-containing protein [Nocardia puris]|uniref:VWA domain containing CoxE-like protein n=1 Tax=Nocardia puris TaxID=208602 RepID=A0A366DVW7_9NOCA|nr:VWA domain-containing protein [Nocardia puris]RBO93669.1 VWA domain containing CoxE-like protein [Nocardia puris]